MKNIDYMGIGKVILVIYFCIILFRIPLELSKMDDNLGKLISAGQVRTNDIIRTNNIVITNGMVINSIVTTTTVVTNFQQNLPMLGGTNNESGTNR